MTRAEAVRAAITYPIAAFIAAVAATLTSLPFTGPAVGLVWIATVAPVGFFVTVLADRITFHRTTNGDRS